MTISMRNLQTKVNEIAKSLGGIGTPLKLKQAQNLARQDTEIQGLMLEILDDALAQKWISDSAESARQFLGLATV